MDHKLMPKHGEQFSIELNKCNKEFVTIMELQRLASIDLLEIINIGRFNAIDVAFPCKQCFKDVALQFHDLAEAIEALVR